MSSKRRKIPSKDDEKTYKSANNCVWITKDRETRTLQKTESELGCFFLFCFTRHVVHGEYYLARIEESWMGK